MTGTTADPSEDVPVLALALGADERWDAVARARDRKFNMGLAAALVLHALLLVGIGRSTPTDNLGQADGADNAISVDLVTEADLKSTATVADHAAGEPAPPVAAQPPPPLQPEVKPEKVQQEEVKAEPQPEAKPEETKPDEAKVEPPPEPSPEPKPEAKPEPQPEDPAKLALTDGLPDALALPAPGAAKAEKSTAAEAQAKPAPKPKPKPEQKKSASLDLSAPAPKFAPPITGGGGAAGFERPPGITRSGANDEFARRVIGALQRTMPQLGATFGRVTVRIVLNDSGNVTGVTVLRSSNQATLDQSVVFAAQQTSYPIPPPNSKDVDRLFMVTYIYR